MFSSQYTLQLESPETLVSIAQRGYLKERSGTALSWYSARTWPEWKQIRLLVLESDAGSSRLGKVTSPRLPGLIFGIWLLKMVGQ